MALEPLSRIVLRKGVEPMPKSRLCKNIDTNLKGKSLQEDQGFISESPCILRSTLYRKSDLWIPRKETARTRSQFLHIHVSASDLYIGLPIWL